MRGEFVELVERHAPGSAAEARRAVLAFDELVGNVVQHAPGRCWVSLDWSGARPVLRVRDEGPGFALEDVLAPTAPRGALRSLVDVVGPVTSGPADRRGADLSLALPVQRPDGPPPGVAAAAGTLPQQVAADGTVSRDAFLLSVAVQLAQAVERIHGPAGAHEAISMVGRELSRRIESEWRRARGLTERLDAQQAAELMVELKAAIGGRFSVESITDGTIVLVNDHCPFGDAVREAPSLCALTASVFGGIAERNGGPNAVRLVERLAVGDDRCRVVVSLDDTSARATIPAAHRVVRAVLAEDTAFLRVPLERVLQDAGVDVVAQCDTAEHLLGQVRTYRPDVAILDLRGAATSAALAAAAAVREEQPGTGVLVLSEQVSVDGARDVLAHGSSGVGYLLKDRLGDVDELVASVRAVAAGGTALDPEVVARLADDRGTDRLRLLTPRELEVLSLIAAGRTNDGIAEELVISKRAVEKHVGSVFTKLGLYAGEHERRVLAALAYTQAQTRTDG